MTNYHLLKQFIGYFFNAKQKLIFNMVFGKVFILQKNISRLFVLTGTQHLLSASAYNVSVFLDMFEPINTKLADRKARFCLFLVLCLGFYCLSDASISIKRALFMRCVYKLSFFFKAQYHFLRVLLIFCLAAISWNKELITGIGFQLSVMATFALWLKLWVNPLAVNQKTTNFLVNFYRDEILTSLLISLFLAPLLLFYFGEFILLSVLLTPFLFWLIPLLTRVGLMLFVAFLLKNHWLIWQLIIWPVEVAAECLVDLLLFILEETSKFANWKISLANLSWQKLLIYYLSLLLIFKFWRKRNLQKFYFSCSKYLLTA